MYGMYRKWKMITFDKPQERSVDPTCMCDYKTITNARSRSQNDKQFKGLNYNYMHKMKAIYRNWYIIEIFSSFFFLFSFYLLKLNTQNVDIFVSQTHNLYTIKRPKVSHVVCLYVQTRHTYLFLPDFHSIWTGSELKRMLIY